MLLYDKSESYIIKLVLNKDQFETLSELSELSNDNLLEYNPFWYNKLLKSDIMEMSAKVDDSGVQSFGIGNDFDTVSGIYYLKYSIFNDTS